MNILNGRYDTSIEYYILKFGPRLMFLQRFGIIYSNLDGFTDNRNVHTMCEDDYI